MSVKVKKFLKWFLIILLVVGSIAATVFIFFKRYNARQVKEVNLISVNESNDKYKFDQGFNSLLATLEAEGEPEWFADVNVVNDNLDQALIVLSKYYISTNGKVKDKEISDNYQSMITTRNVLTSMFNEYNIKSTSVWFPNLVGANDIYVAYSNYLVKYAKLVKSVNENLAKRDGFDTTSDIKFSMIDLYTRIVVDEFSSLEKVGELQIIKSDTNIDEINKYFVFDHSYIAGGKVLTANALKFIQNYNSCNKELFADKFVENLNLATGYDEKSSKEIKAAFFFNEVF